MIMNRLTDLSKCVALLLVLGAYAPAYGQSSIDYFHNSGRAFIRGSLDQALQLVNEGLAVAPDDLKLQALKEEIEKERQESGGQGEQEQGNEEQEGGEGDQEQEPDPNSEEGGQGPGGDPSGEGGQSGQQPEEEEPPPPENMTPEQAELLLEALRQDEEELLRQAQTLPGRPVAVQRDW
jgi:hypothetical protein